MSIKSAPYYWLECDGADLIKVQIQGEREGIA